MRLEIKLTYKRSAIVESLCELCRLCFCVIIFGIFDLTCDKIQDGKYIGSFNEQYTN